MELCSYLHQLLNQTTLSFEQKPSERLSRTGQNAGPYGSKCSAAPLVLPKLFLNQMPCETRKMLPIHDNLKLDSLAKVADRILENDSCVCRAAASLAGRFSQII